LTTEHVVSLFGSAEKLHEAVMAHHIGAASWPDDMNMATGWRELQASRPVGVRLYPDEQPEAPAPAEMETVLSVVLSVCGIEQGELLRVKCGPGGNPARRLAVLSLSRWTRCTQKEIGRRLGMTPTQVAQILHRARKDPSRLVKKWMLVVGDRIQSESGEPGDAADMSSGNGLLPKP